MKTQKEKQQPLIQRKLIRSSFDKQQILSNDNLCIHPQSIIQKYNLFVLCYNKSCNRIDEKTLSLIPHSKIFQSFNIFMKYLSPKILLLLGFLIPIFNIFILLYLFMVIIKYRKGLKIYRNNQRKVLNPMKNMKYDPQKCYQMKKNFYFITLNFKNLSSQYNVKENTQLVKSQGKSGQKTQWMIYNSEFASYYNDFAKWNTKFIVLLVTGIILTGSSNILLFLLI